MGLFALPIYSESAEESINCAISNLNMFLGSLSPDSEPLDYLFSFAETCIEDARNKIKEGKIMGIPKPSGPMIYKVEKGN